MFFKRNRFALSTNEMIEIEEWILEECIPKLGGASSEEDISKKLRLKVEYVNSSNLPAFVEAELRPADESEYNGLIRVNSACMGKAFAYLHEIMHYIYDVGIGNKVTKVFTRKATGHTEGKHEQKINYMAAAFNMRYDKIEPRIRAYDESRPKMDEIKFVNDLSREFGQSRSAVIRRIQEIRRIKRKKAKE